MHTGRIAVTKKIPLGRQDAQFLLGDSPETPMHVGGYNVYRLPDGASDDFVRVASSSGSASSRS